MIYRNQQKNYTLHRIFETKRHKKYSIDKDTQRKDAWQPLYFLLYCMIDYMSEIRPIFNNITLLFSSTISVYIVFVVQIQHFVFFNH